MRVICIEKNATVIFRPMGNGKRFDVPDRVPMFGCCVLVSKDFDSNPNSFIEPAEVVLALFAPEIANLFGYSGQSAVISYTYGLATSGSIMSVLDGKLLSVVNHDASGVKGFWGSGLTYLSMQSNINAGPIIVIPSTPTRLKHSVAVESASFKCQECKDKGFIELFTSTRKCTCKS